VEWQPLKLELLTTQVQKCGRTCLITVNAIFGPWDASCTKCVHKIHHFWPMTWTHLRRKSLQVIMTEYQKLILKICKVLFVCVWPQTFSRGWTLKTYCIAVSWEKESTCIQTRSSTRNLTTKWPITEKSFWRQSGLRWIKISRPYNPVCQRATMILTRTRKISSETDQACLRKRKVLRRTEAKVNQNYLELCHESKFLRQRRLRSLKGRQFTPIFQSQTSITIDELLANVYLTYGYSFALDE